MDLFPRGRKSDVGVGKGTSSSSATRSSDAKRKLIAAASTAGKGEKGPEGDGLFGTAVVTKKRSKSLGSSSVSATGSKLAKRPKGSAGGGASLGEAVSAAGGLGGANEFDDAGGMLKLVTNSSGKGKKTERVAPPNFKQLAPGTLLLGLVKRVTRRQLFVALPYGLSGLVSMGEVSDQRLFEDDGGEEEEDSDEDEEDEDDEADKKKKKAPSSASKKGGGNSNVSKKSNSLESMFSVGQSVRCAVVGTSSTKHGRKSVSVSLKPSTINRGESVHFTEFTFVCVCTVYSCPALPLWVFLSSFYFELVAHLLLSVLVYLFW